METQFRAEQPLLRSLPGERFPAFREARRSVYRDGYVEVEKAYYSAPPEYLGRRMWVRWDSHVVRLFNERWEQVALHARAEPGRYRTELKHIPAEKVSGVERGTDALLRQVATIGPHTRQWAEATVQARGVEAVRLLVGLKALTKKHATSQLEAACEVALANGAYHLRTVRQLIARQADRQTQFDFIEQHPVILRVFDTALDFAFMSWRVRTCGQKHGSVMQRERPNLGMQFGIVPVGAFDRSFEIVNHQTLRHTTEMFESIFQASQEIVSRLTPNDFAVALARIT